MSDTCVTVELVYDENSHSQYFVWFERILKKNSVLEKTFFMLYFDMAGICVLWFG